MTSADAQWRPTGALGRAIVTAATAVAVALLIGDPALLVLAAPFVALATLGLWHRPTRVPQLASRIDHVSLHEGQGTTSRLTVTGADDAEYLIRAAGQPPYVAMRPHGGRVGALLDGPDGPAPTVELSPRRWGRRFVGEEKVALMTPWAGYRFGPVPLGGLQIRVLPALAAYDSRADAPQPVGLVGAHRSQRPGGGTELAGIRPFAPGDRLRRINWRVSLRSRELHVVSTRAEEDTGVLLVVDALADHGASGGIDGAASSLDLSVRAASAIAEHHVRSGDRVALRVVGRGRELVGYGTGARHLRRLQHTLAGVRPGEVTESEAGALQLGVTGGTVVIVLSPMLAESIGAVAATLTRRGVPVLVVDTLPVDVRPGVAEGTDLDLAAFAWRMRALERTVVLQRLAALGCPVVAVAGSRHHRRRAAPAVPARRDAPRGGPMTGIQAAIAELSRSQLVLRALILLGPVVAVFASGPAGHWPPWWAAAVVVALAAGFAALPESPIGAAVMLAVLVWWAAGLDDGLHPAVLVAATALLVSHVASVLATYGPGEMPVEPALVRLWVRRGVLVLLGAPLLWGLALLLRGEPEQPGIWVVGAAAGLVATVAAAVALTARQPGADAS